MRRNCVATYAQYLGIGILEPLVFLAERGCLRGSTRGEIEYVEGEYYVLLALVVRQGNVPVSGRKFEIRGYIANFCRHIFASNNLDLGLRIAAQIGISRLYLTMARETPSSVSKTKSRISDTMVYLAALPPG